MCLPVFGQTAGNETETKDEMAENLQLPPRPKVKKINSNTFVDSESSIDFDDRENLDMELTSNFNEFDQPYPLDFVFGEVVDLSNDIIDVDRDRDSDRGHEHHDHENEHDDDDDIQSLRSISTSPSFIDNSPPINFADGISTVEVDTHEQTWRIQDLSFHFNSEEGNSDLDGPIRPLRQGSYGVNDDLDGPIPSRQGSYGVNDDSLR